jgi:hypothetical protein
MVLYILLGVVTLVALLVVVAALQPAAFHIERSTVIGAAPHQPFAHVNDFRAWQAWSPWEGKDPAMKRTYDGAPSGAGARYAWQGNKDVGEGRMTIESSDTPRRITIELEFIKPFPATNRATFTFAPEGGGTKVTWGMDGNRNLMMKAFSLFVSMDKLVGPDFERGLSKLKSLAEKQA